MEPANDLREASLGLSSDDVAVLRARFGSNTIPAERTRPWWSRLAAELTHFFALMLWAAAILAFVAGTPQLGWAIAAVVVVNGLFAFFQEARAERASAKLRELLPARVRVRRDGKPTTVDAAELVPGDVVLLTAGDRIPADLQLISSSSLRFDESMLTGESEPVPGLPGDSVPGGTFVAEGDAVGLVTATGSATRLAEIARLTTRAAPPPSPLDLELKRIVKIIAAISISVGVAFFLISLLIGNPLTGAFLFAIGVTVAMVPEGLLPTVTLSLAIGAQRMSKRHALVRNLQAVETLGSTTFICTDKTGTLTQNRMSAVQVWTPEGTLTVDGNGYEPSAEFDGTDAARRLAAVLAAGARAASQGDIEEHEGRWRALGDPMEAAIVALDRRLGGGAEASPPEVSFAFDKVRKRTGAVSGDQLWVKGAPESVFAACVWPEDGSPGADPGADAQAAMDTMASVGLRVLAVAGRRLSAAEQQGAMDGALGAADLESGLELLGLLGLHDPPRPTVAGAIRQAREAGIKIAMLTGDHPVTAAAIAREIGLIGDGTPGSGEPGPGIVLDGNQLPEDLQVLGALLDREGVVVSRVSPEKKLMVAQALQQRGHVVAMTGDGVNDGPALEAADIGVAMGLSGTDVARNAADLVLLDDDFATMIVAVEQGRATYSNIRRFLTYHLTDNVAELAPFVIWALSGGHFPLAIGVLQILFLDIGTDLVPALALGSEKPGDGVMSRPPEKRHLLDGSLVFRVFALLGPVEVLFEMSGFLVVLLAGGWRAGGPLPDPGLMAAASGTAFTAVVLGQLANAVACRSAGKPFWRLRWNGNPRLIWAVLIEVALLCIFLFALPVAELLGQAPPTLEGFVIAALAIPGVLFADAAHKAIRFRMRRGMTQPVLPHH
ncbi:cation-transporting P-type ATPase [Arthrobacter sp. PAMC25564]|uniref:cation-translocating P-type ATPase n=1 Tax=Arthrobacter sp. PAMC25564 TaxID=2565366 RepID=UPI0010A1F9FC|nr:cation-transporting P-type ATPase [Arthrobacter sp. PAMC25564]QCB97816.1 cation-transporting P-type ATPase [Arthrobacter sp. PAMC25564]